MITANDVPVALAGTMGDLDTEISDETTTVALEAAVFDSHRIEKDFTAGKFTLRSFNAL